MTTIVLLELETTNKLTPEQIAYLLNGQPPTVKVLATSTDPSELKCGMMIGFAAAISALPNGGGQ